jgi:hypothetical protein
MAERDPNLTGFRTVLRARNVYTEGAILGHVRWSGDRRHSPGTSEAFRLFFNRAQAYACPTSSLNELRRTGEFTLGPGERICMWMQLSGDEDVATPYRVDMNIYRLDNALVWHHDEKIEVRGQGNLFHFALPALAAGAYRAVFSGTAQRWGHTPEYDRNEFSFDLLTNPLATLRLNVH